MLVFYSGVCDCLMFGSWVIFLSSSSSSLCLSFGDFVVEGWVFMVMAMYMYVFMYVCMYVGLMRSLPPHH